MYRLRVLSPDMIVPYSPSALFCILSFPIKTQRKSPTTLQSILYHPLQAANVNKIRNLHFYS